MPNKASQWNSFYEVSFKELNGLEKMDIGCRIVLDILVPLIFH